MHLLFAEFAEKLDREGFVVWRGLLPHAAIDRHLTAFTSLAAELEIDSPRTEAITDQERSAVLNMRRGSFHDDSTEAESLWCHPDLMTFARWRFRAEPVLRLVGTHLFSIGSHLHSDFLATAAPDPWELEFRAWAALEDIDPASGPLYLYPGSHRSIMATVREELLEAQPEMGAMLQSIMQPVTQQMQITLLKGWHEIVMEALQSRIDQLGLARAVPALSKGDVIIFNPGVAHGTMPRDNPERTRKAMIWNLGAVANAAYYMPRAYWGALHDHRCAENAVPFEVEQTPAGLRIKRYLETWHAALARPIRAC